jgi:quinol monooxygenase YgiN
VLEVRELSRSGGGAEDRRAGRLFPLVGCSRPAVICTAIARFAQHTLIRARPGKRDQLVAKFLEISEIQRHNKACELSLVSSSPDEDDAVYLTEVWASAEEHERARESDEIQAWAEEMPSLVAGPPEITPLVVEGGKGVAADG